MGTEFAMTLGALRVDSVDQGVLTAEVGPGIPKLAELTAADQSVIAGVEDKDNIFAPQRGQANFPAGLGG